MKVFPSNNAMQKFEVGEKVRTLNCTSVGTIVEAEKQVSISCGGKNPGRRERWLYKVDWRPDFPDDHKWYSNDELTYPEYEDAFSGEADHSQGRQELGSRGAHDLPRG